jgi:uncharacterized protein
MDDELLEKYTKEYIKGQQVPEVVFAWQGGEPTLLGLEFFKKAVEFQEKFRKPGMRIENALQTNATMLTEEMCQFFADRHFLLGVSLDGPSVLHNRYRKDKGGNPSFDRVMAGIEMLKRYRVDFNILACVSAANVVHPLKVYRFFRDEVKASYIQFIPIVERDHASGYQEGEKVTERSINGHQYGRFLIEIFDEWVRRDVGQVFVQIFDIALGAWLGSDPGLCVFSKKCGNALAIEHNGDLYSCDHFVEPRHFLGNILDTPLVHLVTNEKQQKFGSDKWNSLTQYCRECPSLFACHGGCPKDRILYAPDGQFGLNYLCAGFRSFFTHIDGPMRLMAKEVRAHRPAANIMQILADRQAHHSKESRNDLCP